MVANRINKITSTKTLQPGRKVGLKPPEKPTAFLIQAHRTCERATVGSRNGHSCVATVAISQARLSPFSPVFGLQYMSIKFKQLIISTLKMSPKSHIYAGRTASCKYRKHRGRKRKNGLTKYSVRTSLHNILIGPERQNPESPSSAVRLFKKERIVWKILGFFIILQSWQRAVDPWHFTLVCKIVAAT